MFVKRMKKLLSVSIFVFLLFSCSGIKQEDKRFFLQNINWENREAVIKILKVRRKRSQVGEMVGLRGEIIEFKNGKGFARIRGEIWSVESTDNLSSGEEVVVLERDGLKLKVKKVDGTKTGNREMAGENKNKN